MLAGSMADAVVEGAREMRADALERCRGWFGRSQVFLELQQHLVHGDTARNKRLREVAERRGVATVAANEPWYHCRERSRLHDALTAIRLSRASRLVAGRGSYPFSSRCAALLDIHQSRAAMPRRTAKVAEPAIRVSRLDVNSEK